MSRLTTYAYDLSGNVVQKTLANGTTENRTHDGRNRVLTLDNQTSGGSNVAGYVYSYDLAGNVREVAETYPSGSLANRTITNGYDGVYRLTSEEIGTSGGGTVTTDYEYDKGHDRTSKVVTGGSGAGATSYEIGDGSNGAGANQIISATLPDSSVVGYAYDPNGNRIYSSAVEESSSSSSSSESSLESSSSSSGSSGEEAGTYYEYDYENRLIEVIEEGERFAIYRYQYDYRTRREGRREPGHETHIVFSGGSSILEYGYDGPSEPRVEYVRGHDYGGGVGGLEYSVRGGAASFNFYDSRGDVTTKTDNTGTVTFQTGYEAFGNQTAQAGTPPADRQRASTKEQDPTGLLNEGFRYRDPSTGAFITRDPLGFQAGPNMYTYVRQNPWTKFDPMGLDSSQPNPPPPKIPQPKSPWFGINPGSAAGKILQDMEHAVMPIVQAAEKTARKVATDIIKTMRSIIPNIRSKIADVRAMEQAMRDESTDYMGRVNEAAVLTNEWATGTGPTWNNFYDGPPQVNEMMRSAGMQEAREYYYKKFAGLPIDQWGSVRNLPYKFGVKGLVNAGLNPTQQFVGSFQVWIYTQPNHTAYFYVYNRTSLNSLLYDHGPAYSRDFNLMGMAQIHNIPGGNTYQSFQWSESIPNK